MSIGDNIRKYRKQRGWTIEELATKTDLSIMAIQGLEEDRFNLQFDIFVKIAKVLHVQIWDLDERIMPMGWDRAEGGEKMRANMEQKMTDLHRKNMESILRTLKYEELLCQMAEETAELCQAAMKYRRKMWKMNQPTAGWGEIYDNLYEEIADVMLLAELLLWDDSSAWERIEEIKRFKANRWIKRLTGGMEDGNDIQQDSEELLGN